MKHWGVAIAAAAAISWGGLAEAAPREAFGLDAQTSAQAMAVTASAPAVSAAASNPARLMDVQNLELSAGVLVADDKLKVNGEAAGEDTYVGYQIGLAAALPLGSYRDRLFVGVNAHVPHDGLYEVRNSAVSEPVILGTGSDVRRFSLDAALAVRVWERIAIAVGAHLIPDVIANVNVDFSGAIDASSSHVTVDYKFAPSVGVYAEPVEGLHLGFAYHGATRLSLDVPAQIFINDAIGEINVRLLGYAYAEPHTFSLGVRYDFSHLVAHRLARFAVDADFEWRHYVHPIATSAAVELYDDFGGVLNATAQEYAQFEEAWAIRGALTWMPMDEISASVGYGFRKSPVPAQRYAFNVLDADRHTLGFGATLWCPEAWMGSFGLGISTAAQLDFLVTRDMEKYLFLAGNPGFPSIRYEGMTFAWHAAILLRFE